MSWVATVPNKPIAVSELSRCTWPAQGRAEEGQGCIASLRDFKSAAMQTFSCSSAWLFFRNLDDRDQLLSRLGWALLCAVPMFAVLAYFIPGSAQTVNPWIKPIKFSISFATYAWTASVFILILRFPSWQASLIRRATALSVTLEMILLGVQAWRSAHLYSSHSVSATVISQMLTAIVTVNSAVMLWFLVECRGRRGKTKSADPALVAAIRNSIVIFLLGCAVGGYMLARGSHTVGASDGGLGLPFVNWSVIAGDLRIAHFIAVHAIQIVPLFAYLLLQMSPRPALQRRRLAVLAMSAGVMLVVSATFLQAALGHPLLAVGRRGPSSYGARLAQTAASARNTSAVRRE